MRVAVAFLAFALGSSAARAQEPPREDVIELKSGGLVSGRLVSTEFGKQVLIEQAGGSIRAIPWEDVKSMRRAGPAPGPTPIATPPRDTQWYGYQVLVADVLGIGSLLAAPPYGGVPYFLLAPVVHAANGQFAAAVASFGLRVTVPFFVGALAANSCNQDDCTYKNLIALSAAALAVTVLDSAFLSTKVVDGDPGRPSYAMGLDPRRRSLVLAARF